MSSASSFLIELRCIPQRFSSKSGTPPRSVADQRVGSDWHRQLTIGLRGHSRTHAGQTYRREERSARQVQLTLTALEHFIANLPEEQEERIRVETARRIFAEQREGSSTTVTLLG